MAQSALQPSNDFEINEVLETLALTHLQAPLQRLLDHFEGVSWDSDMVGFQEELTIAVGDLAVLHARGTPPAQLVQRLRIKIPRFEAWRIRASRRTEDGQITFWNPLDQSHRSFVSDSGPHSVFTRVSADDYPAEDIIRHWCNTEIVFER